MRAGGRNVRYGCSALGIAKELRGDPNAVVRSKTDRNERCESAELVLRELGCLFFCNAFHLTAEWTILLVFGRSLPRDLSGRLRDCHFARPSPILISALSPCIKVDDSLTLALTRFRAVTENTQFPIPDQFSCASPPSA